MARFKVKYNNEVKKAMQEKFQYANIMEIPKIEKIVINMGLGSAKDNNKVIQSAVKELSAITGQAPSRYKGEEVCSEL